MNRLIVIVVLLSLTSGCKGPSGTYSPVGQAALMNHKKSPHETTLFVESVLAHHGFKSPGIYLQRKNDLDFDRSYTESTGLLASVNTHSDCTSIVIFVPNDSNTDGSLEISLARESFRGILDDLKQDQTLDIRRDQVCQP